MCVCVGGWLRGYERVVCVCWCVSIVDISVNHVLSCPITFNSTEFNFDSFNFQLISALLFPDFLMMNTLIKFYFSFYNVPALIPFISSI